MKSVRVILLILKFSVFSLCFTLHAMKLTSSDPVLNLMNIVDSINTLERVISITETKRKKPKANQKILNKKLELAQATLAIHKIPKTATLYKDKGQTTFSDAAHQTIQNIIKIAELIDARDKPCGYNSDEDITASIAALSQHHLLQQNPAEETLTSIMYEPLSFITKFNGRWEEFQKACFTLNRTIGAIATPQYFDVTNINETIFTTIHELEDINDTQKNAIEDMINIFYPEQIITCIDQRKKQLSALNIKMQNLAEKKIHEKNQAEQRQLEDDALLAQELQEKETVRHRPQRLIETSPAVQAALFAEANARKRQRDAATKSMWQSSIQLTCQFFAKFFNFFLKMVPSLRWG